MSPPALRVSPADARFMAFGTLSAFSSCFGQTFFVAIFAGAFAEAFGLGPGGFGSLYSVATLVSGVLIIWAGAVIDRVDLRLFAAVTTVALGLACLLMASVPSWPVLGLALFCLRFLGQGMMMHLAVTSMARYFDRTRGRMLAVALLGMPIAEASLPRLVVGLIESLDWRMVWLVSAAFVLFVLTPLLQLLLLGHGRRHARWAESAGNVAGPAGGRTGISRVRLLRDPRFLGLVPVLMVPGFTGTWILFHQTSIVAAKGWDLSIFAASMAAYAAASVLSTMASGILIDRLGALRLLPFYLAPMAAGCLLLATLDAPWVCAAALALLGLSSGASGTVVTAVWAELYGLANIGSLRAIASSIGILASALSPGLVGLLIGGGTTVEAIATASALTILVASLLASRVVASVPDRAGGRAA